MRTKSLMAAAAMATLGTGSLALAADHIDGTSTTGGALSDPSADITDAFAWMSSDGNSVNLVMNVFPGATTASLFSTTAKYVFHTQSAATYGATTGVVKRDVICTFTGATAPQTLSCWVTDPANSNAVSSYINGNPSSTTTPLASADGNITAFAGLRNDPFFFNLAGFRNATSVVAAAIKDYKAGTKTYIKGFDTNAPQCPELTTAGRSTVAGYLGKHCSGTSTTVYDFFKKPDSNANPVTCTTPPALVTTATPNEGTTGNVMSIVLQVKKTLLNTGGPILGVWTATTK